MNTNAINSKQPHAGETPALHLWQQISGIDPQTESEMSRAERNAAIRKLVAEVTERATAEFASEDDGDIPEGERTIFWDPLQRICMELGISRTKLSAYSRELTGMRAHEISDRILANRKLLDRLNAHVARALEPELEFLYERVVTPEDFDPDVLHGETMQLVRWLKASRKFERSASFAAAMGFANYSRLNRACLLAFGKSLDQIESELICTQVQKFFKERLKHPPKRVERQEPQEKEENEPNLTDEEKSAGDRLIKEVVAEVLGMRKPKVCVA